MTPAIRRLHAALLLVVAMFVALEALRYLTTPFWRNQFAQFPMVGVTTSGKPIYWKSWTVMNVPGAKSGECHEEVQPYGPDRLPLPRVNAFTPGQRGPLADVLATAWLGQPQIEESPLVRSGTDGAPWMPLYRHSRQKLLRAQSGLLRAGVFWESTGTVVWRLAGGRIVAEVAARGATGSIGPDGWLDGPPPAGAPRFGTLMFLRTVESEGPTPAETRSVRALFVDLDARAIVILRTQRRLDEFTSPRRPDAPVFPWAAFGVAVEQVPLGGTGPIRTLGSVAYEWSQPLVVGVGDEMVAFTSEGRILGRAPWDGANESPIKVESGAFMVTRRPETDAEPVVVATSRGGPTVIGADIRFRIFADGKPVLVADAPLVPVTTGERVVANIRRGIAVVRPPVLALASFAAPAPRTYGELLSAWLLDPLYAGQSEPLTLVLCLALGALCALRARAQAKLRCPAPRDVAAWTAAAFALGPVGLVWMRLVVPKHAIEPCACGRRRAVSVEACPACGATWPGPAPTGIEVLARPAVAAVSTV